MIRGLYTSALGMTTQMKNMDVVSNNIANVSTTGFKKDMTVTRSFTAELMKRLDDPADRMHSKNVGSLSLGVFVDDVYTDFSAGSLKETGGSLDLAFSGRGFFAIEVTDSEGNVTEKYSRDGSFTLGLDGALMTKEGNRVAGVNGNIVIPQEGVITIDENGFIYADSELVDQIKLTNFNDLHTLRKYGDNLYDTTEESTQIPFTGSIVQGFLENSNSNSVKEMVDMITMSRTYEANQKMITIHDTILGRAVSDIGRK